MKTRLIHRAEVLATALILGMRAIAIQAAEVRVPDDFATIQAAVDAAAAGDTIHITPGTYVEQVAIRNKNLTLIGQPGTILRAFPNMEDLGFGFRNIILVHGASKFVIRGLTIEGDQLVDEQPVDTESGTEYGTRAVYYVDAGGAVADCHFSGVREAGTPDGDARQSMALVAFNDLNGAPLLDLRIEGNTFVDCFSGIYLRGHSSDVSLNVTIENNTIRGSGPIAANNTDGAFAGIELVGGISGTFTGNTISNMAYDGENALFPFHFGVFIRAGDFPDFGPAQKWRIENNTFRNNDWHLMVLKSDGTEILNNRFEGTGTADRRVGIQYSGNGGQIRGNGFRDMPRGILALGDDPDFGDMVGVATDAQIIDNRFRDVDIPVEIQSPATATEDGTLIHPFPEPELAVDQAVKLSWPGYNDDYVVEIADSPEGPWTEATVETMVEDGALVAFMPAADSQKYFRLRQ